MRDAALPEPHEVDPRFNLSLLLALSVDKAQKMTVASFEQVDVPVVHTL